MRKYLLLLLLLAMHVMARGQTEYSHSYWFDNDRSTLSQGSSATPSWQLEADVSGLKDGIHAIHVQVEKETLSSPYTDYFLKVPMAGKATYSYWFDNDRSTLRQRRSTSRKWKLSADISALEDGFHVIHVQVEKGEPSAPRTYYFIKIPQTENTQFLTLISFIDGALYKQERLATDNGSVLWNLDVSDLKQGLHHILLEGVTPSGAVTQAFSAFFFCPPSEADIDDMKLYYMVDGDALNMKEGVRNGNVFHFDVDASELSDGLHRLSYFLSNAGENTTKAESQFFWKTPLGGNGITQYSYWLNDDYEHATTVRLEERTDPLQLMTLLPVASPPIRSSCFDFKIKNGQPYIYAKNDLHLRFNDVTGRFTDYTKQFVDESVKQKVKNAELLESGVLATTAIPAENVIKWYRLEAAPGDSLHFRLNRTATIQLFAPSGEEIYSASGYESVNWTGLHVFETGTYYLALHDVTATSGNDISIEYEHIDRYAVLRQDVAVVGNGGCSTITFDGNGFSDLYDVELFNEQGDIIPQLYIGHESNATTSVTFDFTDVPLGVYSARFHFTGEDKEFANLVTVEEARDIELATTVTYPSTFLQGTSTTYTINITNKGNMTAYNVLIYAYLTSALYDNIKNVSITGLNLPTLYSCLNTDYWSETEKKEFLKYSDDIGDDHYFYKIKMYDEDLNDTVIVRKAYFTISLPPNSTQKIELKVSSSESVSAWFTVPTFWYPVIDDAKRNAALSRSKGPSDSYCCYHDQFECALNSLSYDLSWISIGALAAGQAEVTLAADIAGCISSGLSATSSMIATFACDKEEKLSDKLRPGKILSWAGAAGGCLTNMMKAAKEIGAALSFGIDQIQMPFSLYDCAKAGKKPNCPPNPGGGGGPSTPVAPVDPNDIYGYTAESQSHAVKDGKTDVYYRIEFENDPEFATAPAHDIYVTDVLDGTKFDLSTFAPTRVQIGSKTAELTGEKNFVKTIDMRPEINAIAQVEGTFNEQTGTASWHISSLDPMTMEPTKYVMDGVLPVNTNGQGIGELWFDIELKPDLAHGTEVDNQASIVFDTNDAILTPTWTNTIDRVAPTSKVTNVQLADDGTATVTVEASDELSGPWRYDVYVQHGSGAWFLAAEHVEAGTAASVKVYEGMPNRFYSVATDMAGNVEQKEAAAELVMTIGTVMGDVNSDGKVTPADAIMILYHYFNVVQTGFNKSAADLNGDRSITPADAIEALYLYFGSSSSSRSVSPTTDDGRDPE